MSSRLQATSYLVRRPLRRTPAPPHPPFPARIASRRCDIDIRRRAHPVDRARGIWKRSEILFLVVDSSPAQAEQGSKSPSYASAPHARGMWNAGTQSKLARRLGCFPLQRCQRSPLQPFPAATSSFYAATLPRCKFKLATLQAPTLHRCTAARFPRRKLPTFHRCTVASFYAAPPQAFDAAPLQASPLHRCKLPRCTAASLHRCNSKLHRRNPSPLRAATPHAFDFRRASSRRCTAAPPHASTFDAAPPQPFDANACRASVSKRPRRYSSSSFKRRSSSVRVKL
ncbi:hypothetical protein B0H15DRAFT_949659 [Mycena belliarum]|uniref:Uncharacterized protein n=1 Tax=Mycena belliarum TaxID=1033014 RepID=A0AAD6U7X3_9AGAR|nr:hypothetical protein B0H15DRAFT_949659 [Mycena belliae]